MMQLTLEALFEEMPQKVMCLDRKTEKRLVELMTEAIIEVFSKEGSE